MDTININVVSDILDILLYNAFVDKNREEINTAITKQEERFISDKVKDIMTKNKNELYDLKTYVNLLNNAVREFKGILEVKQNTNNTTLLLKRIRYTDYTEEDLYNIIKELTNCYLNTFATSMLLNRLNGKWPAITKNRLHMKIVEAAGLTEPNKTVPPVLFCMESINDFNLSQNE